MNDLKKSQMLLVLRSSLYKGGWVGNCKQRANQEHQENYDLLYKDYAFLFFFLPSLGCAFSNTKIINQAKFYTPDLKGTEKKIRHGVNWPHVERVTQKHFLQWSVGCDWCSPGPVFFLALLRKFLPLAPFPILNSRCRFKQRAHQTLTDNKGVEKSWL